MAKRYVLALALPVALVACISKTTSLDGSPGSHSSASSGEEGDADAASSGGEGGTDAASSGEWDPPVYADWPDGGGLGQWPCGYSWMPVPASEACQFLLPTERQNESPDLDPATWDPRNVRVDVFVREWQPTEIGPYKPTSEDCGSGHGWYYVYPTHGGSLATSDAPDGGAPTTYALCPTTCAAITGDGTGMLPDGGMSDGGFFRLSAFGWCGGL